MLNCCKKKILPVLSMVLCLAIVFCGSAFAAEGNKADSANEPRISQNFDFHVSGGLQFVTSDNNLLDQTLNVGVTDFLGGLKEIEVILFSSKGTQKARLREGDSTTFNNFWDSGTWTLRVQAIEGYGWCHFWIDD